MSLSIDELMEFQRRIKNLMNEYYIVFIHYLGFESLLLFKSKFSAIALDSKSIYRAGVRRENKSKKINKKESD